MRHRSTGPLLLALAAITLGACGTVTPSSAPPRPAPTRASLAATTGPLRPDGGTPVDVGRVRLWIPATWTLAADACPPGAKELGCLSSPCPPGSADTVTVADFVAPPTACRGSVHGAPSVWVFPRPGGPGRATVRHLRRGAVVVEVPALGVALYGYSTKGARIAESFGRSPLASLLAARLPSPTPPRWRRIAYGTLSAEVPASWPYHLLDGSHLADPGSCGFSAFPSPVADVGQSRLALFCPLIDETTILRANATPGNGVWLEEPGTAPSYVLGYDRAISTVERRVHGLRLELAFLRSLSGSDAVEVIVHRDGEAAELLVGLGRSPRIAEQILSSLQLAR